MKAGVFTMTAGEYHADPAPKPSLSASMAHVLLSETPAHARLKHPRLNPDRIEYQDTKFDEGRAMHSLFLEGIDLLDVFTGLNGKGEVATAWQTNESKAFKAAAYARGRIPVLANQEHAVRGALASLRARVHLLDDKPRPFTDGEPEQTLIWQEDNGVWCRARPDWLHDDHATIDDLKTCASASPGMDFGDFGRAVWTLGHDVQEAFYRRGVRKLFGIDPVFRFVAVELDGPGISCCSLGAAARAIGDAKVERAIALWGDCLARGEWPGFPRFRVELQPPPHELAKWETLQAEEMGF